MTKDERPMLVVRPSSFVKLETMIEIKSIEEDAGYTAAEDLQELVWGMTDRELIPGRMLHALQKNGACLLGAYDQEKLVGFVLGVIGTVEGLRERIDQVAAARLQMYSAIMGVHPDYQNLSIGYQLKLAQRAFALRIGLRLMTWTVDPLESRNARLNFSKLGAVCNVYWRDFHGAMTGINAGLASDRFQVRWWLTSHRVKSRVEKARRPLPFHAFVEGGAVLVNETAPNADGLPIPPAQFIQSDAPMLLVEIPASIQAIKRRDMPLAQSWRSHSRALFEHYFAQGYIITDFVHQPQEETAGRSFYLLTQQE
jgi:predicted GNAT superfamily acetyltransferase